MFYYQKPWVPSPLKVTCKNWPYLHLGMPTTNDGILSEREHQLDAVSFTNQNNSVVYE